MIAELDPSTWGTAADAVAAIGTVGALFVALGLLRRELQAHADERERRRSQQARQVSVWVTDCTRADEMGGDDTSAVAIAWRNGSEEPIYDIRIVVWEDWALDSRGMGFSHHSVWPPMSNGTGLIYERISAEMVGFPPVQMGFTDAGGLHWQRLPHGELVEVAEGEGGPC